MRRPAEFRDHWWSAWLLTASIAGLSQAVDINDTKLLTQPAASEKHIAFVYADDLWICDINGKNVRRFTADVGSEGSPFFSPDGKTIAFTGQYDGNTDVYTIPVEGGSPKRLTWHPGPDVVRGFTPDGKAVLFASPRSVFTRRYTQLFTIPLEGGFPTQLPLPNASKGCYSPDGTRLAYTPLAERFEQWKNYRGGTHTRIWIYDFADSGVVQVPQPEGRCNDTDPCWVDNENVLFRSDRNGEFNIFAYNIKNKAVTQLTKHEDFPVLEVSVGGGNIVYEQAGHLHRLHLADGMQVSALERLKIGVAADLVETRPRYVKGTSYVRSASVSPSGARAVFEVRGEIYTVPAEKGDPRNLTRSVNANDRDPAWSPDGKTVAYFSDAGGEYRLCLAPQDGKGEVKKHKLEGAGFYYDPVWSPDSKMIAYRDNAGSLFSLDVASGKTITVVDKPPYGSTSGIKPSSWSADSKWLTYSINNAAIISTVHVYSFEQNKSFQITDGLSDASEPVFDAGGKYLYFFASTDTGMTKHGFALSSQESRPSRRSIYLAVLQKDLPSPFLPESDEEKGEAADADKDKDKDKDKEPNDDKKPRIDDEDKNKEKSPDAEAKRERMQKMRAAFAGKRGAEKKKPVKIDLEGIDQRILALPISAGNHRNLQAGPENQVFYLSSQERGEGGGGRGGGGRFGFGAQLHSYDVERKRDSVVQQTVMTYVLTPNGRKMLYSTGPNTWMIGSTTGGGGAPTTPPTGFAGAGRGGPPGGPPGRRGNEQEAESTGGRGGLNLAAIDVRIDPKEEWPQIFDEAWRINRDFFYAPNMHGADWPAMREKYRPFVEHCATRNDLNRVIQWMCSELAVGHHRGGGGDRVNSPKSVGGGLLGADYEIANGRYRFKKVFGGLNWSPELNAPLTQPGVNVKAGEYLLAVQGKDLRPPTSVYQLFENTAGKQIEITVGPNPDGTGSRTVTVEPIGDEGNLRNRDWVEGNLKKVHEATNGRVAYVYVPDTSTPGLTYFKRYFFPQIDKDAVIIDERFNGGGSIADYYIDTLARPFTCYWAPRHGADWRSPSAAIHGPKVMIIDETAGSGGDLLPWMFRKFGLGKLVGKRTWGGLVGVGGYPELMDGGTITAPHFAIWSPDGGFVVENEGVPPDIEVEQFPKDVMAGRDPQLEKAIEVALEELKKNPPKKHQRPEYPIRARQPAGKQAKPAAAN